MKYIKLIIIITLLASLAIFISATHFEKVLASVEAIGPRFIILILVTLLSSILGTLSWHSCLGSKAASVSLSQLFLIRHIGETASLFNPAGIVGGEAVKVHLLRKQDIEKKTVLASIVMSRSIMIITQLILFSVAAVILLTPVIRSKMVSNLSGYLFSAGVCITLITFIVFYRKTLRDSFIRTQLGQAFKKKTMPYPKKINDLVFEISSFYKSHKQGVAYAAVFALLHWVVGAMEFYFILAFLDIKVSILQAILVDMGVVVFKTAGIFIPAQAGIEEYGNKIMLAAIGIPGVEIWITVSILRRARQLIWLVFGIGVYLCLYKAWSHRLHQANGNTVR